MAIYWNSTSAQGTAWWPTNETFAETTFVVSYRECEHAPQSIDDGPRNPGNGSVRWAWVSSFNCHPSNGGHYPVRITKQSPRVLRPAHMTPKSLARPLRRIGGAHRSGED